MSGDVALVIPYRDRGIDPWRPLNFEFVYNWWRDSFEGLVTVVSDGLSGDKPFNRSAAYNRAVSILPGVGTFVFVESDVVCDGEQVSHGISLAGAHDGMVVAFSRFLEIAQDSSELVRQGYLEVYEAPTTQIRKEFGSNGAINIISRSTYDSIGGYDEKFSSAWWDDSAMKIAFDICCGPTRFVDGPVYHLYHSSGGRSGAVATAADLEATARNKARYQLYKNATTPEQIRALTSGTV